MRKAYRSNINKLLFGIILPLWLVSFLFGRSSVAIVESQPLGSKKAATRQTAERREAMEINIENLSRQKLGASKTDPFTAAVPKPVALPAAPPPPPPAPVAPSLPYTFLGRMIEDDGTTVFLSKQDRSYSIKLNGVLDRDYRVDKIDNDQVVFTYLPLNIQQTLSFGRSG